METRHFQKVVLSMKFDPLFAVFYLSYSKYKGVKICFCLCRYQNQFFTRVALVSFLQHSCRTRVARAALVLLVSHWCHTCRLCCKLDQIRNRCSQKFCNIHRKAPASELRSKKAAGFQACNFIKFFPVNIAKFLRTFFLQNTSGVSFHG